LTERAEQLRTSRKTNNYQVVRPIHRSNINVGKKLRKIFGTRKSKWWRRRKRNKSDNVHNEKFNGKRIKT